MNLFEEKLHKISLSPAVTVSLEVICTHDSGHTFSFRLWHSIPVTFFSSEISVRTMLVPKGNEIDFYTNSSGIAKQEGKRKFKFTSQFHWSINRIQRKPGKEGEEHCVSVLTDCFPCVLWSRLGLCVDGCMCVPSVTSLCVYESVWCMLSAWCDAWHLIGLWTHWSPHVPSDSLLLMKDSGWILLMFHPTDQTRCPLTCRDPAALPSVWSYSDHSSQKCLQVTGIRTSSLVYSFVLVFSLLLYFNQSF